jgi:hypothetical protein
MPTIIRASPGRLGRKNTEASCRVPHPWQFTSTTLPASASGWMTVSCPTRQSGQVHLMSCRGCAAPLRGVRDQPAMNSRHRLRTRCVSVTTPGKRSPRDPPGGAIGSRPPSGCRRCGTFSADIHRSPTVSAQLGGIRQNAVPRRAAEARTRFTATAPFASPTSDAHRRQDVRVTAGPSNRFFRSIPKVAPIIPARQPLDGMGISPRSLSSSGPLGGRGRSSR